MITYNADDGYFYRENVRMYGIINPKARELAKKFHSELASRLALSFTILYDDNEYPPSHEFSVEFQHDDHGLVKHLHFIEIERAEFDFYSYLAEWVACQFGLAVFLKKGTEPHTPPTNGRSHL